MHSKGENSFLNSFFLISAATAGVTATLVASPVDVVKTRFIIDSLGFIGQVIFPSITLNHFGLQLPREKRAR